MTSQRIAAGPARRPPPRSAGPARPHRPVHLRRPFMDWHPVALAAVISALFVACVMIGIVLLPARSDRSRQVALAEPPAPPPAHPLFLPVGAPPAPADPSPPPAPTPAATAVTPRPDPAPADAPGDVADMRKPPPLLTEAPPDEPAAPVRPAAPVCQTFNTSVAFAVSPTAAEKQAAQDGKLVFLLHVSGDFEDDAFT